IRVVDVETDGRAVTLRKEPRLAGGHHQRIADDDVARSLTDRVFRPCDRHDASGAVELRNVERNLDLAFTIDLNGAGEEGDQLFGGRITLGDQSAAVAAGTDAAEGASRAVDQPAVEVT